MHSWLIAEAAASPNREICGLLIGQERVHALVATPNVAPHPAKRFEIDPAALFAAIRAERAGGERLLGYYHSHPSGAAVPSERDRAQAACDGRIWLIVAGDDVAAWTLSRDGQFNPLPTIIDN